LNNIVKDQHIQHDFQEFTESYDQNNVNFCQNMDLMQHNEIACETFVILMTLNIIILTTLTVFGTF